MQEHILFLMTDRYKYQTNTRVWKWLEANTRSMENPPANKSCVAMVALFFLLHIVFIREQMFHALGRCWNFEHWIITVFTVWKLHVLSLPNQKTQLSIVSTGSRSHCLQVLVSILPRMVSFVLFHGLQVPPKVIYVNLSPQFRSASSGSLGDLPDEVCANLFASAELYTGRRWARDLGHKNCEGWKENKGNKWKWVGLKIDW